MMKKLTPIIYSIFFLALSLCSCESNRLKNSNLPAQSTVAATGEKSTDAKALSDAYNKSLFEKELADNVKKNSTDASIKELAENIISGQEVINKEIKILADRKSISLPVKLTTEQQTKIEGIKNKSQQQLEQDYTNNLVDEHNIAIKTYQELAAVCTDPDIKEWFQSSLRLLNTHLDMANLYKRKLEAGK